jgi:hypothetical protein
MKVFQDVFTNDEVMGEVFSFTQDYKNVIMKVKSSYKSKEAVGNIDIGCGNAFGGSEEEGGDSGSGDSGSEKVLDVAYNFNLVQTSFSKGEFMAYIKNFLKNLKTYLEENGKADRVPEFQAGAQEFIKFVISKFDEFEFYTGTKESLDGGIIFSFWEDETASGPVFYYFFDSLKEVKY